MGRIAGGSAPGLGGLRAERPSRVFLGISTAITGKSARATRARAISRTLLAFLVLGTIWRVARYAACPPLWGDEAFLAVNLLIRDFAGLLQPLEYYQIAPAGFLWAELAVIRTLGSSEWSLRLIPFLSGLASLGLFSWWSGKLLDRRSALMAVGIFAASFYPVRHATEVKPYATDLLFSLMTMGVASSLWLDRESARKWLGLTVVVAVGVWFSYPLVFVAAGVGSVLGFGIARRPTRRAVASYAGFGLVAASSWLVSYVMVAGPQAKAAPFYTSLKTWKGAFPPIAEPWHLPFWLLDVHSGNMLAYPHGGNHFGSLATAVLVFVGGLALRRTRPALLVLLLSPLVPTLIASTFQLYPYGTSARTTLYMAPSFCLLGGVGLVALIRKLRGPYRRRAYRLASLVLLGMMAVATVVNIVWPYKNHEDGENRRAVVDLARMTRPGDRWIVYDGVEKLRDSRGLMLEHWLQQMAEVRYNVLAHATVPVAWIPAPEAIEVSPGGRTWLIVHRNGCPYFDEGRLDRLERSLALRLGPPRERIDRLTRGESIEAFEYPSSVPVPDSRR